MTYTIVRFLVHVTGLYSGWARLANENSRQGARARQLTLLFAYDAE